jgi:hypothetical protein
MTQGHVRTVTAAAAGIAGCLLLAGCSSSSRTGADTPPTHTINSAGSSSIAASTSAAGDPAGASSPAAAAGGTVACTLVTEHDATTALGADPGPASRFASHGSSQCQYGSYRTKFLLVNLTPTRGKAAYDLVHNSTELHAVDLAGVGDRAFEVSGPGTAGIYFTKGDALVVVSVTMRTATPPEDQALALAKIAQSRV